MLILIQCIIFFGQSLCHSNIVEMKGVVNDPGLLLVMEYLPMGSLLDYFRICYTKPNEKQLLKFAQDVAEVNFF